MSYLVVVAHPDDETLGAGALIYALANKNISVNVCILSGMAEARSQRPDTSLLKDDTFESMKILGVNKSYIGDFPNIELNTVPHLLLVQFIEKAIIDCTPDTVITHHPSDLNNDHGQTSIACQAAIRLFQRRQDVKPVNRLLYAETLSSTDWALNTTIASFRPNTFFEVGEEAVNKKISALKQYRDVIREYPHPRSPESIKGLAAYRGSQAGVMYAEAFESAFERIIL